MRYKPCSNCGKPVRDDAWACPECGMVYEDFRGNGRYYRFAGILIFVVGAVLTVAVEWRFLPMALIGGGVFVYGRLQGR